MSFHQNFDLNAWICIFIFGAICCSILIASLCMVIYQYKTDAKMKKTSASIKWCSLLSLGCFILAIIWNHFYIICNKLPGSKITKFTENIWGIYNSFWSFGYFFTYLLFYLRLRQTFGHTQHKLSTDVSIIFLLLLFVYIISQQIISFVWLLFVLDGVDWEQFNGIYNTTLWIKFITDFVLNIYIVYIFCSKIFKMTVEKKRRESAKHPVSTQFKNEHSAAIFDTMIKYFLLTFLTVLSTQLFTASEITLSLAIDHAVATGHFEFYYTAYICHFLFALTDSMVSTTYIILTFPFAKIWYSKYCHGLHLFCLRIWGKCVMTSGQETKMEVEIEVSRHGTLQSYKVSEKSANSSAGDS